MRYDSDILYRPTPRKRLFLHRPLIRPLRGHIPLSLLSLRDISP